MGLHIPAEVATALSNAIGNEQLFVDLIRQALNAGYLTKLRAEHFVIDYYQRQTKLKRKLMNTSRFTRRHIEGTSSWPALNNSNACTPGSAAASAMDPTSNSCHSP